MATELRHVGAEVEAGPDYIKVTPPATLKHASIATYNDHRMAMCFSMLAFAKAGVVMFVFMDLARAPLVLRLVATAWLACVLCALVAIYAGLLG